MAEWLDGASLILRPFLEAPAPPSTSLRALLRPPLHELASCVSSGPPLPRPLLPPFPLLRRGKEEEREKNRSAPTYPHAFLESPLPNPLPTPFVVGRGNVPQRFASPRFLESVKTISKPPVARRVLGCRAI